AVARGATAVVLDEEATHAGELVRLLRQDLDRELLRRQGREVGTGQVEGLEDLALVGVGGRGGLDVQLVQGSATAAQDVGGAGSVVVGRHGSSPHSLSAVPRSRGLRLRRTRCGRPALSWAPLPSVMSHPKLRQTHMSSYVRTVCSRAHCGT